MTAPAHRPGQGPARCAWIEWCARIPGPLFVAAWLLLACAIFGWAAFGILALSFLLDHLPLPVLLPKVPR